MVKTRVKSETPEINVSKEKKHFLAFLRCRLFFYTVELYYISKSLFPELHKYRGLYSF